MLHYLYNAPPQRAGREINPLVHGAGTPPLTRQRQKPDPAYGRRCLPMCPPCSCGKAVHQEKAVWPSSLLQRPQTPPRWVHLTQQSPRSQTCQLVPPGAVRLGASAIPHAKAWQLGHGCRTKTWSVLSACCILADTFTSSVLWKLTHGRLPERRRYSRGLAQLHDPAARPNHRHALQGQCYTQV